MRRSRLENKELLAVLAQLWKSKDEGDVSARNELIERHRYLVENTQRRMIPHVPSKIDVEDILSEGLIGLVRAVETFDPRRKVKFTTYAMSLIRGAILEYLRREDWAPRSMRTKEKLLRGAEDELRKRGQEPTDAAMAEYLKLDLDAFAKLKAKAVEQTVNSVNDETGDADNADPLTLLDRIPGDLPVAEDLACAHEAARILHRCIRCLPPNERKVLVLRFFGGLSLKQAANQVIKKGEQGELTFGVSESRAQQLQRQALMRIKGSYLTPEELNALGACNLESLRSALSAMIQQEGSSMARNGSDAARLWQDLDRAQDAKSYKAAQDALMGNFRYLVVVERGKALKDSGRGEDTDGTLTLQGEIALGQAITNAEAAQRNQFVPWARDQVRAAIDGGVDLLRQQAAGEPKPLEKPTDPEQSSESTVDDCPPDEATIGTQPEKKQRLHSGIPVPPLTLTEFRLGMLMFFRQAQSNASGAHVAIHSRELPNDELIARILPHAIDRAKAAVTLENYRVIIRVDDGVYRVNPSVDFLTCRRPETDPRAKATLMPSVFRRLQVEFDSITPVRELARQLVDRPDLFVTEDQWHEMAAQAAAKRPLKPVTQRPAPVLRPAAPPSVASVSLPPSGGNGKSPTDVSKKGDPKVATELAPLVTRAAPPPVSSNGNGQTRSSVLSIPELHEGMGVDELIVHHESQALEVEQAIAELTQRQEEVNARLDSLRRLKELVGQPLPVPPSLLAP